MLNNMTIENIITANYLTLYQNIYNNIDEIMLHYDDALNPMYNNTTMQYINDGYTVKESYALSFMLNILLLFQLNM